MGYVAHSPGPFCALLRFEELCVIGHDALRGVGAGGVMVQRMKATGVCDPLGFLGLTWFHLISLDCI